MKLLNKKKELKEIIDYFGESNQLYKKTNEELHELQSALFDLEYSQNSYDKRVNRKHVIEEMADCVVMFLQLAMILDFDVRDVKKIMDSKIERTIKRIESGYYAKK